MSLKSRSDPPHKWARTQHKARRLIDIDRFPSCVVRRASSKAGGVAPERGSARDLVTGSPWRRFRRTGRRRARRARAGTAGSSWGSSRAAAPQTASRRSSSWTCSAEAAEAAGAAAAKGASATGEWPQQSPPPSAWPLAWWRLRDRSRRASLGRRLGTCATATATPPRHRRHRHCHLDS